MRSTELYLELTDDAARAVRLDDLLYEAAERGHATCPPARGVT